MDDSTNDVQPDAEDGVEFEVFDLKMINRGEEPEEVHDFLMQAFQNDELGLADANLMLGQCRKPAMIDYSEEDAELDEDIETLTGHSVTGEP